VRVVLHIAVQEDQDGAPAVIDPGLDRRRLAEVAAKADDADSFVPSRHLAEALAAAVTTAIVDVQDLE